MVDSMLPYIEKPTSTDARLVSSTGLRAAVRRSTIGVLVRSSHGTQIARSTTEATARTRVVSLVQPQWLPLVTGSRKATSARDSRTAPTPSKDPGVRRVDSGTTSGMATSMAAAIAAETQNNACQLVCAEIRPASGRPAADPMPRVADMRATAPPTRSRGSSSRMIEMPTGMSAAAKPCRARPATTTASVPPRAPSTDPRIWSTRQTSIIRRLPCMSASRLTMGVATALVSRVAVTSQDASSAVVCSRVGNSGSSGTIRVCCSATIVPVRASTVVTRVGLARLRCSAARVVVGAAVTRASRAGKEW